jgi:hypothetical protein
MALSPVGLSKAILPWTVFPGLMSLNQVLPWPLVPPKVNVGRAVGAELAARHVEDVLRAVVQGLAFTADVGDLQGDDRERPLGGLAEPELGIADALAVADLGDVHRAHAVKVQVHGLATLQPGPEVSGGLTNRGASARTSRAARLEAVCQG